MLCNLIIGQQEQFGNVPFQDVVRGNADGKLHATLVQGLVDLRLGEGGIGAEHYLLAQLLLPLSLGKQKCTEGVGTSTKNRSAHFVLRLVVRTYHEW